MTTGDPALPRVARRVGSVLLGAGALVGAAAMIWYATGVRIELSPWIERVLLFKVLLGGGIGMTVLGAWLLRATKRSGAPASEPTALPRAGWSGIEPDRRAREKEPSERSND